MLSLDVCYETIMFGQVTLTLEAAAMRVRSYIRCSITCVSLIEILTTINKGIQVI